MRNGYAHRMMDELTARVRRLHGERAERLAALRTREEALAYQAGVREAIERAFFGLRGPGAAGAPARPEPLPVLALGAEVTGSLARPARGDGAGPGFRINKVRFESRPGLWVTANLYIPHDLQGPVPAVLATCGHSEDGKAEPLYQAFCQWLARCGLVVLIYDPLNQGERDQYVQLTEREAVRGCTSAHNMMGKQLELLGENLALWRAWDGMRALDYLLAQPEVDPRYVGVTGNSGGGTMSTWLWAIEPRLTMAAPSCFVTTFLHNLENELPADAEQYPPGVLGAGLEMADFLIARAPQPAILLGQRYDYFDRRGFREACAEVRRFYEVLGAPTLDEPYDAQAAARALAGDAPPPAFAWYMGPHPHGFREENQAAMVRFFLQHAASPFVVPPSGGPSPHAPDRPDGRTTNKDSSFVVPPSGGSSADLSWIDDARPEAADLFAPRDLWATEEGNVVLAGATPIYELIARRAQEVIARATPLGGEPGDETPAWAEEPAAPELRIERVSPTVIAPGGLPPEGSAAQAEPWAGGQPGGSESEQGPAGMFGDLDAAPPATPVLGGLGSDASPAGAVRDDVQAEPPSTTELGGLGSDHTPAGVARDLDTGGLAGPVLGGLGSDAPPAPACGEDTDTDVARLRDQAARLLRLPEGWQDRAVSHYRILRPTRLVPTPPPAETPGPCFVEGTGALEAADHQPSAPLESISYSRYAVDTCALPPAPSGAPPMESVLYRRAPGPERAHTLDVRDDLGADRTLHLYLPHFAAAQDLASDSLALALQGLGPGLSDLASDAPHPLYALDVRGLGESAPDEEDSFWGPYGMDYMAHGYAGLLGETLLGWRVLDVLCTIDLLVAEGAGAAREGVETAAREPVRVHLIGRGQGAVLAAFVALFHLAVSGVTLKNAPVSYLAWASAPLVYWPAANIAPGALRAFDLPELYSCINAELIEPWDERMETIRPGSAFDRPPSS